LKEFLQHKIKGGNAQACVQDDRDGADAKLASDVSKRDFPGQEADNDESVSAGAATSKTE
jgi:hypothetical protein